MPTIDPFAYPRQPHRRRHGPAGYTNYQRYRPWLEDEFVFRCVYCLKRMVWAPTDIWSVDHIIPQVEAEDMICVYDNLVLACQYCNRVKSNLRLPDPCQVAYGKCLRVETDGVITAMDKVGRRIVATMRLNNPKHVAYRRQKLRDLHALASCDPEGFESVMGFPAELPNLKELKVKANHRPEGVKDCWYEKRLRGELPKTL